MNRKSIQPCDILLNHNAKRGFSVVHRATGSYCGGTGFESVLNCVLEDQLSLAKL
jgi:hypothetical protein